MDRAKAALALLGLIGFTAGCNEGLSGISQANAQSEPSPTYTPSPTVTPPPPTSTPTATPLPTNTPTATRWPSPTAWPTPTPWTQPASWQPARLAIPTVEPLPVVPTTVPVSVEGAIPVAYSPPNEVDVFGNVVLRWEYGGLLAEDEFFDIKIKPFGSENSAFVDWSKSKEYELRPWNGWSPGLYTWQIGIVKGYLEGDTKHFIEDTGRDSQKFVIKWQNVGHGGDGGSSGGGSSGGS